MKQFIFVFLFLGMFLSLLGQEKQARFSYATTVGTGIPMSKPSLVPFDWQVLGWYNMGQRFALGVGTGISVYEKVMVPLFGDVKFRITRPLRFTPYVECGVGYAFSCGDQTKGGFYLAPSVGTEWGICKKMKMLVAVGYELQSLERVKAYQDTYISSEFQEHLNHGSISFRIGVLF